MKIGITFATALAVLLLSSGVAAAGTSDAVRADGLRWTAMAKAYAPQAGGHVTPQGLKADGLRLQGVARRYLSRDEQPAPNSSSTAGVIALFAGSLVVLLLVARRLLVGGRRENPSKLAT